MAWSWASRVRNCSAAPVIPAIPIGSFFKLTHNSNHPDNSNSAGQFDFRYGNSIAGVPFSVYMQNMFMDGGLPKFEDDSNVFGASIWIPRGDKGDSRNSGIC